VRACAHLGLRLESRFGASPYTLANQDDRCRKHSAERFAHSPHANLPYPKVEPSGGPRGASIFVGNPLRPWKVDLINIALVDDHAIVRSGLQQLFSTHVDLRVVGEASNGREAVELLSGTRIDVMVMDLSMPGQGGKDCLGFIRAKAPDVGVIIFTGLLERDHAIDLIRQGASAFLNKGCDGMEIVNAVRAVSRGRRYLTPAVAELLAQQLNRKDDKPVHAHLSQREMVVFLALARGGKVSRIAETMGISLKTVSTYRTRTLGKMGLLSNSALTHYAMTHKLME
jgi:two-component system invasion response regulator UvrY